ncbi:MAG: hypothetical protein EBV49_12450 [Betaproteobacteria bacterium]|nr:hypothetical protein [Betaproteobacteria bacterium]
MTKEQKAVYDKVKEEGRISLNGNDSVINHLTVLGKLAQITSGYYLHPEAEEPVRIEGDNPKLDLLCERVASCVEDGHSVINGEGLKKVKSLGYHGAGLHDRKKDGL